MAGKTKRQRNLIKDINQIFRRLKKLERASRVSGGQIDVIEKEKQPASDFKEFGAKGTGAVDEASTLTNWLEDLGTKKRRGYIPQGTYLISYVDETYNFNLDIECHPDAVFLGKQDWQDFNGNGSQTIFTVSTFNWFAAYQGSNVDVIDIATGVTVAQLESGVDYVRSGPTFDLSSGTSPYGAVASGDKLRISGTAPILHLRSDATTRINWEGGTFDCSNRSLSFDQPSGVALLLHGWHRGRCNDVDFLGATDYSESRADMISDSGLLFIDVRNFSVNGCYFRGFGDLGVYASGDADAGPEDNGGDVTIRDNTFYGCENGLKAVRQFDRTLIHGNKFIYCGTGVFNGFTGGIDTGNHYIVSNNHFKFIGRRAIDLRSMAQGAAVHHNRIEDIGYMPDGTTPYEATDGTPDPAPTGIYTQDGIPGATIDHNWLGFKDWDGDNSQRAIQISNPSSVTSSTFNQVGLSIEHNYIKDFPEGIRQSGTTGFILGNRYENNFMENVTDEMIIAAAGTRWSYIDPLNQERYFGKGSSSWKDKGNTWTPTFIFSTSGGTFAAPSIQRASYNRDPYSDEVTVRFELAVNITAVGTGELRISGLPFTPAALGNLTPRAAGSIHTLTGPITPPTGTMFYTLRQNGGSATMSIIAHGANAGTEFSTPIDNTHLATGTTTVSGSLTYEAP